jgi:protein-S-isoprenylcysteine O-methyltransferase Ste14
MVAYQAFEFSLLVRRGRDEFQALFTDSEFLGVGAELVLELVLAIAAAWFVTPLAIPGDGWAALVVGLLIMCVGTAIRLWAVVVLGRFFRPTVVLQPEHRVIEDGPYRFVRHPSYTGILLVQAGFGLALGNFLSLAICVAITLHGVRSRIFSEEETLCNGLGDEYRDYAARTSRLVPGVW